jgi:restriction system protein
LENSSRGVWALTEAGVKTKKVDKEIVKRKVVADDRKERLNKEKLKPIEQSDEPDDNEEIQKFSWQEQIIEELQNILPSSFERLCQRLLRELGFQNVEVNRTSK